MVKRFRAFWMCFTKQSVIFVSSICVILLATQCRKSQQEIEQPDLTICGFITLADGLGKQSLELMECLKDDYAINFKYSRDHQFQDMQQLSQQLQTIIQSPNPLYGKVVIFEDALYYPYASFYKCMENVKEDSSIRIAYSMFESSRIPDEWVTILNSTFDAVVVPDAFLVDVYHSCGVIIPVFVIPLSIELDDLLALPLKQQANCPFVFTNLSSGYERKNQITLVKAFAKAFKNNENVILKINCREWDPVYKQSIEDFIHAVQVSNIQLTDDVLPRDRYVQALKAADCYVNVSKGEGFSIQPREAMALGIPVIVSNNTAQQTICKTGFVKGVAVSGEEIALYREGYQPGYFYRTSIDELAAAMAEVYFNYSTYLAHAASARDWVLQYRRSTLKSDYKTLVKPAKVVLSCENKIAGNVIYTTDRKLQEKYEKIILTKSTM